MLGFQYSVLKPEPTFRAKWFYSWWWAAAFIMVVSLLWVNSWRTAPLWSLFFLEMPWVYTFSSADDLGPCYCFIALFYCWWGWSHHWDTSDWEVDYSSEGVHFPLYPRTYAFLDIFTVLSGFHLTAKVSAIRKEWDSIRVCSVLLSVPWVTKGNQTPVPLKQFLWNHWYCLSEHPRYGPIEGMPECVSKEILLTSFKDLSRAFPRGFPLQ